MRSRTKSSSVPTTFAHNTDNLRVEEETLGAIATMEDLVSRLSLSHEPSPVPEEDLAPDTPLPPHDMQGELHGGSLASWNDRSTPDYETMTSITIDTEEVNSPT